MVADAGLLDDLLVFDPASGTWTDLTGGNSGSSPSPRGGHGFASDGNLLYEHGGWNGTGTLYAASVRPQLAYDIQCGQYCIDLVFTHHDLL